MVEENKVEKKEQPKPIEVKIPDDIVKIINELKNKKAQLINQFLNISFQLAEMQDAQKTTKDKVKSTDDQIRQKIQYSFDKLKLKKRTQYRWSYNGSDTFVGHLVPEPPKTEEKK